MQSWLYCIRETGFATRSDSGVPIVGPPFLVIPHPTSAVAETSTGIYNMYVVFANEGSRALSVDRDYLYDQCSLKSEPILFLTFFIFFLFFTLLRRLHNSSCCSIDDDETLRVSREARTPGRH